MPIPKGDFDGMAVYHMNQLGHMVGVRTLWKGLPSARTSGYFWSPETGTVDLGVGVTPLSLNDNDLVVGRTQNSGPFRWTPTSAAIQKIPGMYDVADVNDAGQILGRQTMPLFQDPRPVVLNPDG